MDQGTLQGIATILAMVAFLGVCWWAYSSHKKRDFEEAAQLPFAEDEPDRKAEAEQSLTGEEQAEDSTETRGD
ncbi:MAG: cbb3-type cytochrome c oxidase subunit 3 [Bacteroidales bacterium]|nr:cbb3-type cytochrome c oxidase subunit 3 [Bacteroidales bacterium]